MKNKAMKRKLQRRAAIDISGCQRTAAGDYILPASGPASFRDGVDYCDASLEKWVWSIGKSKRVLPSVLANNERRDLPAGTYLASLSDRFYPSCDSIECIWLR